jgi:hypothetical protein
MTVSAVIRALWCGLGWLFREPRPRPAAFPGPNRGLGIGPQNAGRVSLTERERARSPRNPLGGPASSTDGTNVVRARNSHRTALPLRQAGPLGPPLDPRAPGSGAPYWTRTSDPQLRSSWVIEQLQWEVGITNSLGWLSKAGAAVFCKPRTGELNLPPCDHAVGRRPWRPSARSLPVANPVSIGRRPMWERRRPIWTARQPVADNQDGRSSHRHPPADYGLTIGATMW